LEPNEVEAINLQIDTKNIETGKTVPIVVKATDGIISHEATAQLSVMTCYAAEVTLTPETASACPKANVEFSAMVKNTGIKPDTYDVGFIFDNTTYPNGFKGVNIAAGASQTFKFTLPVPQTSGSYKLYAVAVSPYVSLTETSVVTIKSMDVCYAVTLKIGNGSKTIQTSKAIVVPVTVKNTGEVTQNFTLTITGPSWVYLSPKSVQLAGGEEDTVYLYISPPYATLAGDYKANIVALSENAKAESSVQVSVLSAVTVPENVTVAPENVTIIPPSENITAPPVVTPAANVTNATPPPANVTNVTVPLEGNVSVSLIQTIPNVTINATIGNISGLIIALPINWKTVAVIIIAIIILIILIVRFALLVK
jgi:uncharacterized membrane protein